MPRRLIGLAFSFTMHHRRSRDRVRQRHGTHGFAKQLAVMFGSQNWARRSNFDEQGPMAENDGLALARATTSPGGTCFGSAGPRGTGL